MKQLFATVQPASLLLWLTGTGFMSLSAAAAAADAAPAVSSAGSLLQVFIGLVAVLLLIFGTAWVAKRLGVARGGSSNLLHVISSVSVGARERVVMVEIGDNWLVVGVAAGSVNALMTLPKGESLPAAPAAFNSSFAANLKQLIEARRAK
jgi:flagellar protein FliO/FliZ